MVIYGRSEEDGDKLADAGLAFLAERAAMLASGGTMPQGRAVPGKGSGGLR